MTVVLLHGLGVGQRYFDPLAAELGGVRVRPELRRPQPMDVLATEVEAVLEAELEAQLEAGLRVDPTQAPFAVVANSMGCQYAVELAARRPDLIEALVLVGPTVDPAARSLPRQLGRLLATTWYEPLRLVAIVARDYLTLGPVDTLRQARHALAHRLEERLPQVSAPTIVIRGAHDRLCPEPWARQVVALLPDAQLVTVAGAGHAAHFSHPSEVAAALRRLRGETPAARA